MSMLTSSKTLSAGFVLRPRMSLSRRRNRRVTFVYQDSWPDEKVSKPPKKLSLITEAEDDDMANSNILLLRKVFDKENSVFVKIIWASVILSCFALTVAQISDRLRYFMSEPVSVNVQIERNSSMEFPQVTMCNKSPFRATAVRELKVKLGQIQNVPPERLTMNDLLDYYDVHYLWRATGYNIPEKIRECYVYRSETCMKYGNWTPLFTILGLCYTYKFEHNMFASGPYQSLYFVLEPDEEVTLGSKGWKLLIHHNREYSGLAVRTDALTLYPNTRTDVVVELRKFRTMNTKLKPCNADLSYQASTCMAYCLFNFIARNVSCRLPNMDLPNYPVCNTSKLHNKAYALHDENLSEESSWNSRQCNCPRQCRENIFSTKNDIRWWPNNNRTVVRVYFEDLMYESVEETLAYGLVSLLSDTGGILGLFLGACVLTIFEFVEALASIVKKKVIKWTVRFH